MKTIYKFFWSWDYEKEEKWLNDMADQGLCLKAVRLFRYEFIECEAGKYQYRQDFFGLGKSTDSYDKYIAFMEETGAEHVSTFFNWIYFRKSKDEGEFEIYSDRSSRISYLDRILWVFVILGGLNFYFGVSGLLFRWKSFQVIRWVNLLNLSCAVLLGYGAYKLYKKRKLLKKDQDLFE